MSERYSHRNGETEPPTKRGYYFFAGSVIKPGQIRGSRQFFIGLAFGYDGPPLQIRAHGKLVSVLNCYGRWWGPVTPPWEADNEQ